MTPSAQPTSLPALLYLLSIDLDRHKLADRKKTGYIVRAAALVDLSLRGNLTADADGTVRIRGHAPTGDPVLDTVLRGIADDHHRSWKDWIRRHDHETLDALEDQLISAGAVSVERRAFLGD